MSNELKEAKKLIGSYSHTNGHSTKVYKLSGEHNEGDPYHVKLFKNGKHYEPADYFTNDEQDAHSTARHMVKESSDIHDLVDEPPISFNRRVDGKYKVQKHATGRVVKGKSYGAEYDAGSDETEKAEPKSEVKRGRGRPRKDTSVPKKLEFPSSLMPKVLKPKNGYKTIQATRKVRVEEVELDEAKTEYHPSHPYGLRHMEFMGREKRLSQKETWHKTAAHREKYIDKLEAKGNYHNELVVSTSDPDIKEQSMAAMGRHAEREWHDELSNKSGQGNAKNRHHLVKNGQRISSHASERDALKAWSEHPSNKGMKIVHEDYEGNEYEYGINSYQDGILYKYEVTLDENIIREGHAVTLAGAETMGIRKLVTVMEKVENIFEQPSEPKQVLNIAKSIAINKE